MLIEVALLQRFVLLLGHPVYSLTVTLFSVLLGTGIGSLISRRISDAALPRTIQFVLLGDRRRGHPRHRRAAAHHPGRHQRQPRAAHRAHRSADCAGRRSDGHAAARRASG